MNDEDEYVEEVSTSEDYYEDDDFTLGDAAFLGFFAIIVCAVFAFVVKTITKHIKNVNLKVGDKIQVGIESKDNEKKKKVDDGDEKGENNKE